MNPGRRACLLASLTSLTAAATSASGAATRDRVPAPPGTPDVVHRGRALVFPRDHGSHTQAAIEWWYLTAWLGSFEAPTHGLQVTFFRRRTGLADAHPSRFAARHLLFAHAAVTDLRGQRHHHAQRMVRWNGDDALPLARCDRDNTALAIQRWQLHREGGAVRAAIDGDFTLELTLDASTPPLLQGDAGFSRKGPDDRHASHYYSQPQLPLQARLSMAGQRIAAGGRAWLDHEWSDALMPPDAVGWDWIGINLADGSALTAFQLRRSDGRAVWAGGSLRRADGQKRVFSAEEVSFEPLRRWVSGTSGARYPVAWRVRSPAGEHLVNALLDTQELDHRQSTGVLYWEGLSELTDPAGRRTGLGYLEMTGYGAPLRL